MAADRTHDHPGPSRAAEEIANGLTHFAGFLFGVTVLVLLTVRASVIGSPLLVVSSAIYGSVLVLLYLASTLYHALPHARMKSVLHFVDRCAIHLLIAGTYTPFALVAVGGAWGWSLFGASWGTALLGILWTLFSRRRFSRLSSVWYILEGWLGVVAIVPFVLRVPPAGLALVLAGGIAYTGGVAFFHWRTLPFHHAIWHLFVLAGSAFHFAGLLVSV
ncbi:MAG: hemolysin III family protein [Candidatus Peribacteraceae bacterium]|nr:hemolysin III family protein [Candidatus Peribacteraceae bacterium]